MRIPRQYAIISCVSFFIGMLVMFLLSLLSSGSWQATGDGRTIFDRKTGELVNIHTGENVREKLERDRRKEEEETDRIRREEKNRNTYSVDEIIKEAEDQKKNSMDEIMARRNKAEAELLFSVGRVRQEIAEEGLSAVSFSTLSLLRQTAITLARKGSISSEVVAEVEGWTQQKVRRQLEIFQLLKEFASKYSSIIISRGSFRDLEPATRPLLIKDSLSEKETSFLLEVLGKSIRNRKDQDRIEWENANSARLVRQ